MLNILDFGWHWVTGWVWGWGGIGGSVAVVAWALWYFTPGFLAGSKSTLLHVAIGATVFALASGYFFTSGMNYGYQLAINQYAAKDKRATDAVHKATTKVDDCINSGREWDTTTGMCK